METGEWLDKTTADEIMHRDVVTVNVKDSMADAASLLLTEQVTGAPVVDEGGACRGVLSASDFLGAEEKVARQRREVVRSSFFTSNLALPVGVYEDKLAEVRDKIAPAAEQPVERFMTADVVSVREETPLRTVLRRMIDAHIHRVVVLDEAGQLRGIISTSDVLAALLRQ